MDIALRIRAAEGNSGLRRVDAVVLVLDRDARFLRNHAAPAVKRATCSRLMPVPLQLEAVWQDELAFYDFHGLVVKRQINPFEFGLTGKIRHMRFHA